jgi:translation elongation factor EF-1beta
MAVVYVSLSPKTSRRADLEQRVSVLERENQQLKKDLFRLEGRVAAMETRVGVDVSMATGAEEKEEDFDLFGSDEENAEPAKKVVPDNQQKKAKKPPVVAKSTIVLEVKPWDTETDMKEVERLVRGVAKDGLLWGASKLVPVAFGIMKLQISCVIEDEKVGTDFLEESITAFEDHVQSVDVVAFNKI